MHMLVQLLTDDDGEPQPHPEYWHLVDPTQCAGDASLCTQEFFGPGESAVEFRVRASRRGGITCPLCVTKIKAIKAIQL